MRLDVDGAKSTGRRDRSGRRTVVLAIVIIAAAVVVGLLWLDSPRHDRTDGTWPSRLVVIQDEYHGLRWSLIAYRDYRERECLNVEVANGSGGGCGFVVSDEQQVAGSTTSLDSDGDDVTSAHGVVGRSVRFVDVVFADGGTQRARVVRHAALPVGVFATPVVGSPVAFRAGDTGDSPMPRRR